METALIIAAIVAASTVLRRSLSKQIDSVKPAAEKPRLRLVHSAPPRDRAGRVR